MRRKERGLCCVYVSDVYLPVCTSLGNQTPKQTQPPSPPSNSYWSSKKRPGTTLWSVKLAAPADVSAVTLLFQQSFSSVLAPTLVRVQVRARASELFWWCGECTSSRLSRRADRSETLTITTHTPTTPQRQLCYDREGQAFETVGALRLESLTSAQAAAPLRIPCFAPVLGAAGGGTCVLRVVFGRVDRERRGGDNFKKKKQPCVCDVHTQAVGPEGSGRWRTGCGCS